MTAAEHQRDIEHDTAGADYVFDGPDVKGKGTGSYVLSHLPTKDGQPQRDANGNFAYGE